MALWPISHYFAYLVLAYLSFVIFSWSFVHLHNWGVFSVYHYQWCLWFYGRLHLGIINILWLVHFLLYQFVGLFLIFIVSKVSVGRVMVNYIHIILHRNYSIIFDKYISLFVIVICYLSVEPSWYTDHVYVLIISIFLDTVDSLIVH